MSSLSDKQARFTRCQALFCLWVNNFPQSDGRRRRLRDGYAYRGGPCNSAVGGHPGSTHTQRLARDWILDIWDDEIEQWVYQTDTEAYAELGAYWESLDTAARWGGRFSSPDGNHFSFEHEGVK